MFDILITGASGQLGTALAGQAPALGFNAIAVGRPVFDFDRPETIPAAFASDPRLVINAAAYTGVDAAEADPPASFRANAEGPALLAKECARRGIPLIHVSTDYVFDGTKGAPYREEDPPAPLGVYGASKLAGEQAVLESGAGAIVLRTSWLYAARGKNFLRTILAASRQIPRLRVVADQRGCPTLADDLAAAILAIATSILRGGWKDQWRGLYHAAGTGWTTWHGFAVAACDAAEKLGLKRPAIAAITTADWPTPARRPADSRLDSTKLHSVFGLALPPWRQSLVRTVAALMAAEAAQPISSGASGSKTG